uniref:Uncharacterized protein n=1 Tax=Chromera velia CCMP2878 TaxID=1169474 RepID=A0A0G4GQW1_9ALVE|eukprot:Cvel_22976.t1-p1 / transcript=Cvel_22976.t1 / gene=Cvel_22976 / organism=Chromera_velia_CCMP2878 / gene_product=hypothetical protein / transcript_product=hypothetical protein / location=Cvel_scaffold2316:1815-12390(-) / protein_length=1425 / sequence_SO=supercontig / SO=protein_coding / is_pseudo=false
MAEQGVHTLAENVTLEIGTVVLPADGEYHPVWLEGEFDNVPPVVVAAIQSHSGDGSFAKPRIHCISSTQFELAIEGKGQTGDPLNWGLSESDTYVVAYMALTPGTQYTPAKPGERREIERWFPEPAAPPGWLLSAVKAKLQGTQEGTAVFSEGGDFAHSPAVLGALSSDHDPTSAWLRLADVERTEVRLFVEADGCTSGSVGVRSHSGEESVDLIAVSSEFNWRLAPGYQPPLTTVGGLGGDELSLSALPPEPRFEVLTASFDEKFVQIEVSGTFTQPAVFALLMTRKGGDAAIPVARLEEDSSGGFTVKSRLVEPQCFDGPHVMESASFLVMEQGLFVLPEGGLMEVGSVEVPTDSTPHEFAFRSEFKEPPIVLAAVQRDSQSEILFVKPRLQKVKAEGFHLLLEGAGKGSLPAGTLHVGFFAVAAGAHYLSDTSVNEENSVFKPGNVPGWLLSASSVEEPTVMSDASDVSFHQAVLPPEGEYTEPPVVFGNIASHHDIHTAEVRLRDSPEAQSSRIYLDADGCEAGADRSHEGEVVMLLTLGKNFDASKAPEHIVARNAQEPEVLFPEPGEDQWALVVLNGEAAALRHASYDELAKFLAANEHEGKTGWELQETAARSVGDFMAGETPVVLPLGCRGSTSLSELALCLQQRGTGLLVSAKTLAGKEVTGVSSNSTGAFGTVTSLWAISPQKTCRGAEASLAVRSPEECAELGGTAGNTFVAGVTGMSLVECAGVTLCPEEEASVLEDLLPFGGVQPDSWAAARTFLASGLSSDACEALRGKIEAPEGTESQSAFTDCEISLTPDGTYMLALSKAQCAGGISLLLKSQSEVFCEAVDGERLAVGAEEYACRMTLCPRPEEDDEREESSVAITVADLLGAATPVLTCGEAYSPCCVSPEQEKRKQEALVASNRKRSADLEHAKEQDSKRFERYCTIFQGEMRVVSTDVETARERLNELQTGTEMSMVCGMRDGKAQDPHMVMGADGGMQSAGASGGFNKWWCDWNCIWDMQVVPCGRLWEPACNTEKALLLPPRFECVEGELYEESCLPIGEKENIPKDMPDYQPGGGLASQFATVECVFTVDNVIKEVYYNGVDMTSKIQPSDAGSQGNWQVDKTLKFMPVPGASLVFVGEDLGDGSGPPAFGYSAGCGWAGVWFRCFDSSSSPSAWNGATPDSSRMLMEVEGWDQLDQVPEYAGDNVLPSGTHWPQPCRTWWNLKKQFSFDPVPGGTLVIVGNDKGGPGHNQGPGYDEGCQWGGVWFSCTDISGNLSGWNGATSASSNLVIKAQGWDSESEIPSWVGTNVLPTGHEWGDPCNPPEHARNFHIQGVWAASGKKFAAIRVSLSVSFSMSDESRDSNEAGRKGSGENDDVINRAATAAATAVSNTLIPKFTEITTALEGLRLSAISRDEAMTLIGQAKQRVEVKLD